MPLMRPHALLAVFLVALAPAQRTWIVDGAGGPGVDFVDIPPAVAAAQRGDRIRVRGPWSYSGFTITKGLTVEAESSALCTSISIAFVPSGDSVRVSGFHGTPPPLQFAPHVVIMGCVDTVMLSDMEIGWGYGSELEALSVNDSSSVLVTDSKIASAATGNDKVAAVIVRSRAVFQRCQISGRAGTDTCEVPASGGKGGAGIRCSGATVAVVDSSVSGGKGGTGWECSHGQHCGGDGGSAVEGDACIVFGRSSLSAGAAGGNSTTSCTTVTGLAANGPIRIAAEVTTSGALAGGAQRVRSLAWIDSPGFATLGAPVTVNLRGVPFTGMLLHIDESFGVTPLPPLETPYLGTLGAVYVAPFVIGPTGVTPFTFTVPYLPQCAGRLYYLHALAIEPGTNAISFTNLGDMLLR